ncbi:MAG TPA: hypothetical protein VGC46_12445 [Allosphingosinicella sp.]
MKSIMFGATALLLSGTAMAASAPTVSTYGVSTYSWTASPQLANAAWTGAMTYDEASAWTADKPAMLSDAHIAEKDAWVAANPMAATTDVAVTAKPVAVDSADGQGGPYEPVAATSWPACDPGPGDDRCIQLYEPGVRGAFAQWSAGRDRLAVGGPFEPVTVDKTDKTMVGADPTTEPTGVRVAKGANVAMDHANMVSDTRTAEEMQNASVYGKSEPAYTGVGGPLEEVRDYPRCRSRSDDRCQQDS